MLLTMKIQVDSYEKKKKKQQLSAAEM